MIRKNDAPSLSIKVIIILNSPSITSNNDTKVLPFFVLKVNGNCILLSGRAREKQIKPGISIVDDIVVGEETIKLTAKIINPSINAETDVMADHLSEFVNAYFPSL